ncbi:MAG: metallophosphoesterase [Polyangia bacterium]
MTLSNFQARAARRSPLVTAALWLLLSGCAQEQNLEPREAVADPESGSLTEASTCAHPLCEVGASLKKSCDPCVSKVCAADPYCCSTAWNSICVREVQSICHPSCGDRPDMELPDLRSGPADGGRPARLRFAAFGDTRPETSSPASPYPTAVVESIFRAIDRQAVDFVVVSGDYIYVSGTDPARAAAQMDTFLTARKQLSARTSVHYVLGNHEDRNIPTFQAKLSSEVYWSFTLGDAKVVAIANDAWDAAQGAWLDRQLATPTRYTFVFRHQYWGSHGTTHDAEIQPIVQAHPFTLFIAGHDHSYKHKPSLSRGEARDVIAGNGGAPFDTSWSSPYYGYILVEQQPDDRIQVTSYKVDPGMDVPPVAMDSWTVSP